MKKREVIGILFGLLSSFNSVFGSSSQSEEKFCTCYDYIIVGNGTAGAVVARRLSNNHKNRVLVLEVGRNRVNDPLVRNANPFDPAVLNEITFNPKYAVCYPVTVPTLGQAGVYSEGRMWGGCSAHNYLQAVRGTPSIYNEWAKRSGNSRWTYHNLLKTMKKIETYTPNGTTPNFHQRGQKGPVFITQTPPVTTDPLAIGFSVGSNTPMTMDYNDYKEGTVSISANQEFITPGLHPERSFSQPAYLAQGSIINANGKGLHGRRLKIVSGAFVSRVLFDGKKAVGVEYIVNPSDGEEKVVQVYAGKKIILSAGAINTPAILQRSGIGNPKVLKPLGIPVLVNNPNVGQHLNNQYGPVGVIIGATASNAVGFIDAFPFMPNDGTRRIQLGSEFFGPTTVGVFGFLLNPKSRGSIVIQDTNPFVQPKVSLNMYTDGPVTQQGSDAYLAVSFYKILQSITAAIPGATLVYPTPADYLAGDSALLADAQNISTSIIESHITSTTRMAKSIKDGVVNGNLHVFGVKNLMIADIGIEPEITDANTCFGAYIIGQVAADILEAH